MVILNVFGSPIAATTTITNILHDKSALAGRYSMPTGFDSLLKLGPILCTLCLSVGTEENGGLETFRVCLKSSPVKGRIIFDRGEIKFRQNIATE